MANAERVGVEQRNPKNHHDFWDYVLWVRRLKPQLKVSVPETIVIAEILLKQDAVVRILLVHQLKHRWRHL